MKRVSTPNSLRSAKKQVFSIAQNHTWHVIVYIGNVHNAQVTHSRTGRRISHGCTFVAICIGP